MLKVVTFMKQVARGLQMEGNFGTAHVYRSSLNAIIAYCGKEDFTSLPIAFLPYVHSQNRCQTAFH